MGENTTISKLVIGRNYLLGIKPIFEVRYTGLTIDNKHYFKNLTNNYKGYDFKIDNLKKYNVREI